MTVELHADVRGAARLGDAGASAQIVIGAVRRAGANSAWVRRPNSSRTPRQRHQPNSSSAASEKRSATATSGAAAAIWALMAIQLVPQIATAMPNSCRVDIARL